MLIGICGGICAGKQSVADFLVERHGFQRLYLRKTAATPDIEKSAFNVTVPHEGPRRADSNDRYPFIDIDRLVDFVTNSWLERWVTTDIWDEHILDVLQRRPFFLLLSIDAPVTTRWKRFKARCKLSENEPPSLEEFVLRNDNHLFHHSLGLARIIGQAQVRLLNSGSDLPALYTALQRLDLTDEQRLRPSWDQYFMQLASLAAQRSNCMKRRVGCVLIRERRVISTGYNGTPRGIRNCNAGGCPRCNDGKGAGLGLGTCLCIHAEENALLEAGRERIREGAILYCDTCPCLTCSIKIAQVGISEVVFSQSYSMDTETAAVFKEANVKLRQFSPPRNGLVDLVTTT
ncbi:MAG: Deoxycytidine monophosphate (dCMP) deaminase [Thelocarpon impressellum]|nr:MAG: Deoxycytidine monophosphate (dCMP) deaminase [Thelocarpon impressellum]